MYFKASILSIFPLLLFSTKSMAHKPSYANDHSNQELAFEVEDADISIVLYAEMTCTEETLWLEVETEDREEIWVELGVPQIDRLSDYRPSLAIVGKGFPEADLPFDLPSGMGATVIDTSEVTEPTDFYEPYTGTSSWILFSGWVDVPVESTVYLVAWNPDEFTGKLWVAIGKVEDFSDVSIDEFTYWREATAAFHEVGDLEEHVELDCSLVADDPAPSTKPSTSSKGCFTASPTHGKWVWLAIFGVLWRRQGKHQDPSDRKQ
ncbi:MAG: hypothetical protein CL930_09510 [Deltaproteobacteria bacterium]|nr:hypothetical protein [Deltaproteobacteria bacterium]